MMGDTVGSGGFLLPLVYQKSQDTVAARLSEAEIDYAELTKWGFPDEFFCFVMETGLLEFMDKTYPNPREKNEVPIWFLITCQFLLRLHQSGKYDHLRYLLNAGSILSRFGFNVGTSEIGFNQKNKYERQTAVDTDTVRKFFKDTKADEIRDWYGNDLQVWFRNIRAYDRLGIFILDQTHLVVPDNPNYKDAVKMPVDIHGQYYPDFNDLTEEQKKSLIYHRCYALSTLLNISPDKTGYHIAGYEMGPGNEDELVQADRLISGFCKTFPGVMQELIVDRGYISGEFINKLKGEYQVDILVPLKTSMETYRDAVVLATNKNEWSYIESQEDINGRMITKTEAALVNDIELWSSMKYKQQAIVSRFSDWDDRTNKFIEKYSVFVSTKQYRSPIKAIERYRLRMQTEERFRQFKNDWYINEFPSPHKALIESHVAFTLLTYSLLQLYFRRHDIREKTKKMITSLRMDEQLGKDAVLIYSGDKYGVFDLDDYTVRVAEMADSPRAKLKVLMEAQKKAKLKRQERELIK